MIKACACGKRVTEPGREECFHCRVSTIGFAFRGGAVVGRDGFHMTKQDFLREHTGSETEKQLAKRQDIEKV